MKWVTIFQVSIKIIFTASIFILVKSPEDVYITAGLHSIANVAGGLFAFFTALRIFKIKLRFPSLKEMIFQLKDGWYVFITTIYNAVYVNSTGFILGLLTNNITVGYYSAAEKIVRAVASLFNPLTFAFFPYISKKFGESMETGLKMFFYFLKRTALFGFIFSLILYFFADLICYILLREDYEKSAEVMRILSVIPFAGIIGVMMSYQLFFNIGLKRSLPYLFSVLVITDISLCYLLIPEHGLYGAAFALLVTEVLAPLMYLGIYYFYFVPRNKKIA
jgi:polysaccharide transporter, PST family